MNQPVHIFKKDALHLWPETLVTLALLGALVWVIPHGWVAADPDTAWLFPVLGAFLKFLIPVAWLVLISRLVHDETLVGDRQFWITRPYTWYGLLAAKLLFLAVVVYLPLLIAQSWLLHHFGLHPTSLALPFLKNFAGITFIFILPLIALAAVTSTFVRFALCVLGGIIYLFTVIAVAAFTVPNKLTIPYTNHVITTLLIVVPLAALLIQYALRRTALARTLLIALPAVIFLIILITPADALMAHMYSKPLAVHATFDPNPEYQQTEAGKPTEFKHKISLLLPAVLDGLDPKTLLRSEHQTLTLDGPDGFHYAGPWTPAFSSLNPGPRPSHLFVVLPIGVYDKVKDTPVALHIHLGVEQFVPDTVYTVTATEAPFPVLDHGSCKLLTATGALQCAFPFGNDSGMSVIADATAGTCATPGPVFPLAGSIAPSAKVPSLDPVSTQDVTFDRMFSGPNAPPSTVCPGAKLHISRLKSTGKASIQIDIPAITASSYAVRVRPPGDGPR